MIAHILQSFSSDKLSHKINYQLSKIENGVGRELYNSSCDKLDDMYKNMCLVAGMNDRIKLPFIEFVLSAPEGERLSDDKFLDLAKEYIERMGYGDSCYSIIRNNDNDHSHVHIIATRVDFSGNSISDNFSRFKSFAIMRELEEKYKLEPLKGNKEAEKITLGEHLHRQYYFDTAMKKGLRSYSAKTELLSLLRESENYDMFQDEKNRWSNSEWRTLLGDDLYERTLAVLSKKGFFNPLYKDELLQVLDETYARSGSVQEFRDKLAEQGVYMRLVSDKGQSHYVYGIKEMSFYVKDTSLPLKYRWGSMGFDKRKMTPDEQKHYLYTAVFHALNTTASYDDFKTKLSEDYHVEVKERSNRKGVYGLTFTMTDVDEPVSFAGSDLSRKLTYANIQSFYSPKVDEGAAFVTIANHFSSPSAEKEILYMSGGLGNILDDDGKKRDRHDDEFSPKKKKKKRPRGMSI